MYKLRSFLLFCLNPFHRRRFERGLSLELNANLDLLIQEKIVSGLSPAAARRSALLEFGGIEQVKEQVRETRTGYQLDSLGRDLRYAVRSLRRTPGFATVAIVALGISGGAASLSFSLSHFLLAHPIRFLRSNELFQISEKSTEYGLQAADVSLPKFRALRNEVELHDIGGYTAETVTFKRSQDVIQGNGIRVTETLLDLLGVQTERGQLLGDSTDAVLLTHRFWKDRFGGDDAAIGEHIFINGKDHTIVGVLAADLSPPLAEFDLIRNGVEEINFLIPEQIQRGAGYLRVIVRSSGPGTDNVRQVLERADDSYQKISPHNMDARFRSVGSSLGESVTNEVRPFLYALCWSVGGLFLLACINICCLFLARLNAHHHELTVRAALGAEYRRILQQVACEATIIIMCALVLAMLFSCVVVQILPLTLPLDSPRRIISLAIRAAFILFGIGASFLIGAAAFQTKQWYGKATVGAGVLSRNPLESVSGGLVAGQIAISLVLMLAAVLLWNSLRQVQHSPPGFDPRDLLVSRISIDSNLNQNPSEYRSFVDGLLSNLEELSGVERAATAYGLPFSHDDTYIFCDTLARQETAARDWPAMYYRVVSPRYFDALRIPVIAGRSFDSNDTASSAHVVLVSAAAAQTLFGGADPIGQKVICGGTVRAVYDVVGVVGDVRSTDLTQPEREGIYFSAYQQNEPMVRLVIKIGSKSDEQQVLLIQTITKRLNTLNPEQPAPEFETMEQLIAKSVLHRRQLASALEALASLAVILTMVGVYSMVRFAVLERQHEIAVRLALGASRKNILHLVLGRGFKLVLGGALIGAMAAPFVSAGFSRLLAQAPPMNSTLFVTSSAVLILLCLVALCLPARRAIQTNPIIALRS